MSLPIGAMKRKADDLEDSSDEEEPMLGRQVLPVANLPDTFDGVPTDGMQYLFMVRCVPFSCRGRWGGPRWCASGCTNHMLCAVQSGRATAPSRHACCKSVRISGRPTA